MSLLVRNIVKKTTEVIGLKEMKTQINMLAENVFPECIIKSVLDFESKFKMRERKD